MIKLYKQGNKVMGVWKYLLSREEQLCNGNPKEYLTNLLLEEIKKGEDSNLFTYNIMEMQTTQDFYGLDCVVVFEFIPNKELIEELKTLSERLQTGL